MNPHRPREPRKDGAALRYLSKWRRFVELYEGDLPDTLDVRVDWPCCYDPGVEARDVWRV